MKLATFAAMLAFALAPATLSAQDGQFDLRGRATPSPEPTVVGPVDPETPVLRPRPANSAAPAQPPSEAPAAPTATPSPTADGAAASPQSSATRPAPLPRRELSTLPTPQQVTDPAAAPAPPPGGFGPTRRPPAAYQPRDLDLVADREPIGLWIGLGALALLLGLGGWLLWSGYYRNRAVAAPAPEIERPRVARPEPAPAPSAPAPPAPTPLPHPETGLHLALQATRMSATLINTTLSYRLSLTNRGAVTVRDVRVEGDMVSAHASRRPEELFGPFAAVLPDLHRVPALAPGESVTLTGEIRLPLVAITPIRRGNAAFFVPLARLRARGLAPTGVSVEGGGTYLVGQEPGANRKLQPFRLDLGPRNYSKLGQHLLPAA